MGVLMAHLDLRTPGKDHFLTKVQLITTLSSLMRCSIQDVSTTTNTDIKIFPGRYFADIMGSRLKAILFLASDVFKNSQHAWTILPLNRQAPVNEDAKLHSLQSKPANELDIYRFVCSPNICSIPTRSSQNLPHSLVVRMVYKGGCYCGEIRYTIDVSPDNARTSLCHCLNCKVNHSPLPKTHLYFPTPQIHLT